MPSSACLPLGANGPVNDMEKPILIGSPAGVWAWTGAVQAATARAARKGAASPRRFSPSGMLSSSRWRFYRSARNRIRRPFCSLVVGRRSLRSGPAPDLIGKLDDHGKLRPLLVLGQDIA